VLSSPLPARRPRTSPRKVKCATSRYLHRDDGRPLISTTILSIDIGVHTPALTPTPLARKWLPRAVRPSAPRPPTRRERVVAILASEPRTDWSGKDLAQKLQIRPHNMLTQLAECARLGFLTRTGAGTYALPHPATGAIRHLDRPDQNATHRAWSWT
jgi:hypothetical protein